MKHIIVISLLLTVMPFSIMSQVALTDALINQSEIIKLKWKFIMSNSPVHKTSFGPYTTIDVDKGKRHFVGRQHDSYFTIVGKSVGMKRSVSTVNSQPFSLTILQEGGDTIISNLDLTTIKGGNHALVEMTSGNAKEQESIAYYCDDLVVQVKLDSLNWHMPATDENHADYNDFPLSFDRILSNGVEKIYVTGADGFPTKRRAFENHTKGIVFVYNKKQIAALETYPESAVYFSNDIKPHHKQIIAGVMISLLSIANSTPK